MVKTTITFILSTVVALTANLSLAGRYELIKGKGVEVCEAYAKNLNSFNPHEPMICGREINPEMKDFKKPNWVEPDLAQARALEFDMAKLTSRVLNRPEPKDESQIKVFTAEDSGWPAWRWVATVDIDNDGVPDKVLKKQQGDCPMQRAFGMDIAVLTQDSKHYDLEKSKYIDMDYARLAAKLKKDTKPESWRTAVFGRNDSKFHGGPLYDIFLYKNTTYFDLWEIGKDYPNPRAGRLHVLLRKDGTTKEICKYRFVP